MNETFYHILSNGVKIVLRHTPSKVIHLGVMVAVGTRDEQPEENGMAHYIEHCVFKGTKKHTARQIIRSIEGIGGEVNAYTTKEETTFYATTLVEHITITLRLLAEMVLRPTFPKNETDKERTVIFDEIESYNDSPSELIYDDFESLIFRDHPLALPILGTKKTLRHISHSPHIAQEWRDTHYLPNRMVVFFQGHLDPQRAFRLAEQEFGAYLPKAPMPITTPLQTPIPLTPHPTITDQTIPPTSRTTPAPLPPATLQYRKHTHQVHAMLGTQAYPLGHPLQLPLFLLNNIIGGGSLNSRLNLSLREAKGLVYTVESNYTPLSDTGYWSTYFACDPEHLDQCLYLIYKELQRLCDKPLSHTTLRRALIQLRGQMAISALNSENNALAMAKSVLYHNNAPTWEETFERITLTTPEQLLQTAQEILLPSHLSLLTYR